MHSSTVFENVIYVHVTVCAELAVLQHQNWKRTFLANRAYHCPQSASSQPFFVCAVSTTSEAKLATLKFSTIENVTPYPWENVSWLFKPWLSTLISTPFQQGLGILAGQYSFFWDSLYLIAPFVFILRKDLQEGGRPRSATYVRSDSKQCSTKPSIISETSWHPRDLKDFRA